MKIIRMGVFCWFVGLMGGYVVGVNYDPIGELHKNIPADNSLLSTSGVKTEGDVSPLSGGVSYGSVNKASLSVHDRFSKHESSEAGVGVSDSDFMSRSLYGVEFDKYSQEQAASIRHFLQMMESDGVGEVLQSLAFENTDVEVEDAILGQVQSIMLQRLAKLPRGSRAFDEETTQVQALIESLYPGRVQQKVLENFVHTFAKNDPQGTLHWSEQFPHQGGREILQTAYMAWMDSEPAEAIQHLIGRRSTLHHGDFSGLLTRGIIHLSQNSPRDFLDRVDIFPSDIQTHVIDTVLTQWVESSPQAAYEWISQQEEGEGKDLALMAFLRENPPLTRDDKVSLTNMIQSQAIKMKTVFFLSSQGLGEDSRFEGEYWWASIGLSDVEKHILDQCDRWMVN